MKRIRYEIPRWSIFMHRSARGLDSVDVADPPALKFADELFERLLTASEPELLPDGDQDPAMSGWAERVHSACSQLPEYERLAKEVSGDADAAALAVETLLDTLRPEMDEAELRRSTRGACGRAAQAVEELRDATEGLQHVTFGRTPGTVTSTGAARVMPEARSLAARLRADPRLRKIAQLAGRFRRIAATKRRLKLNHGADEISDVEQGAAVGQLLPVELGRLVHPQFRLLMLRDFLERRCLQYKLAGVDALGRGPLVLCLDKSGSMEGDSDIWSTAVALALLDLAHHERRTYALVCFNGSVIYEAVVLPGASLPASALFTSCCGGTSIDAALCRGLALIATHGGQLHQADIVLVTDGGSDPANAPALRERSAALGVTILGVGIDVPSEALNPWCDEAVTVSDTASLDDKTASQLFSR